MKTTATQRRIDREDNLAMNAAEIAHHLPHHTNHMDTIDKVVRAARLLADIEAKTPDFWDSAVTDWSSVCFQIARFIVEEGDAPILSKIMEFAQTY